jgi:hypothetical protein
MKVSRRFGGARNQHEAGDKQSYSVALVRKQIIPPERPQLASEVSTNIFL